MARSRLSSSALAIAALGRSQLVGDLVQAAHPEDPADRALLQVAGPRVLRQIADAAAPLHRAGRRLTLAGEHPGERRLARPVPADETDLLAGCDPEAGMLQQQAGAGA